MQQLCAFELIDCADTNLNTHKHAHTCFWEHMHTHLSELGHVLCQQQSNPNRVDVRLFHISEHWEEFPQLSYLSGRQLGWLPNICFHIVNIHLYSGLFEQHITFCIKCWLTEYNYLVLYNTCLYVTWHPHMHCYFGLGNVENLAESANLNSLSLLLVITVPLYLYVSL